MLPALSCSITLAGPSGTWWWQKPENRWGMIHVAGDPVKEDAAISELLRWNIDRIYGSYGTRPIDEPSVIYTWNQKLNDAGVESQLLLSENTWIFPENRTNLLEVHIQPKLIDFNSNAGNSSQAFDALHLDVEPHGLPDWSSITPAQRNTYLLYLRDMFHDVRTYLDAHTTNDIPVYADLPVWFDHISDSTGWTNEADRNAWFDALGNDLDGISLMAYERSTLSSISNGVEWEIEHFAGDVRVGLEVAIGTNETWTSFGAFTTMLDRIQSAFSPPVATEIYNFYKFEDQSPAKMVILTNLLCSNENMTFTLTNLTPGKSNYIEHCYDLTTESWTSTTHFISWTPQTNWSESTTSTYPQTYFRVLSK